MIKSFVGVWRGPMVRGFTPKTVLGKLVLVNETEPEIVYSVAEETSFMVTDKIVADLGEAVCFTHQFGDLEKGTGRVVVGPEAEVESWVRYYFFEPHLLPNPDDLTIENCFLKIKGVAVTDETLRSYGPEVVLGLQKILRGKYTSTAKSVMVELLLNKMNKPQSDGGKNGTKN